MSGWETATIKTEAENLENVLEEKAEQGEIDGVMGQNSLGLYGYDAGTKNKCEEILEEINVEVGDKVLVIKANDTSDSGSGVLYEVTDTEGQPRLNQIDEKIGYQGAMANDVTGYFREEHDISGHSRVW